MNKVTKGARTSSLIAGLLSISFLWTTPGCQKPPRPQTIAKFHTVDSVFEARLGNARNELSRDSTNVEKLFTYGTELLREIKFRQETARATYNSGGYYRFYVDNQATELDDLIMKLAEATRRDSSSLPLYDLLGNACYEACKGGPDKWWEPYNYFSHIGTRALQKVLAANPSRIDARLHMEMLSLSDTANLDAGRQRIHAIADAHPTIGAVWYFLGEAYRRPLWKQMNPAAVKYFEKALPYGLSDPLAYLDIAEAYLIQDPGAKSNARRKSDLARKALECNPYCLEALLISIKSEWSEGDFDGAAVYFLRADEVDANHDSWYLHETGDFLDKLSKIHPENYRVWLQLAGEHGVRVVQGDSSYIKKIKQAYERAISLRPDLPVPYIRLGLSCARDGMAEKADSMIEIATRLAGPESEFLYYDPFVNLGMAYESEGKFELAEVAFEKALHHGTRRRASLDLLDGRYERRSEQSKNPDIYRNWINTIKKTGVRPSYIAMLYEKMGEVDSAYVWYCNALKNITIYRKLGTKKTLSAIWLGRGTDSGINRPTGDFPENYNGTSSGLWDFAYVYLEMGKNYLEIRDTVHAVQAFAKAKALGRTNGPLLDELWAFDQRPVR